MKIFVSGQIEDIKNVRKVQAEFVRAGHRITHDWTANKSGAKMLGSTKSKLENLDETKKRAVDDINGVMSSDIYVICTDNAKAGKGMYVELGVALALNAKFNVPKIYLLGNMNHMSIFYLHPAILKVDNISDILNSL